MMKAVLFVALSTAVFLAGCSSAPKKSGETAAPRAARNFGPWNMAALKQVPVYTNGVAKGQVQEIYYEGEPYQGKPTRVFAYLARPSTGTGPFPAMLLVHGGGGKAFRDWAEHWARRGYVALAMDTAGAGPAGRLPDGGPDQSDAAKFQIFTAPEVTNTWTYHAVAAVVRGHSLLASLPGVDPKRVGITGISWGGYLTCIVAGIDDRLKVAVPVYGCGFLGENSYWVENSLAMLPPDSRQLWLDLLDPSKYLGGVDCPILFLNGSNDFAYPMDSYRKSYRLVPPELRHVSVVVNLPHGHYWTFPEVDRFVDAQIKRDEPWTQVGPLKVEGNIASATVKSAKPVKQAVLNYTLNAGKWQGRQWKTVPAEVKDGRITAEIPEQRPLVIFLSATDARALRVSSEHEELP